MTESEYIIDGSRTPQEKREAWHTAMGLQAVDGLEVSEYLKERSEEHINGERSMGEVEQLIRSYYETRDERTSISKGTEEADKVSVNIAKILGEKAFSFSVPGLLATHKRIFEGVFDFAGRIRDFNITKKEWVLDGDTVLYTPSVMIQETLEYDLGKEKNFDYSTLGSVEESLPHLTGFIGGLWQIHPFAEGNTRTTAVFTIQYLRSLGFTVDNHLFEEHSWYFRNALVRANYQNVSKGISRDPMPLRCFFENLLTGANHELSNHCLHVRYNEKNEKMDLTSSSKWKERKP